MENFENGRGSLKAIGDPTKHHLYEMFEKGDFSDFTIHYGAEDFKVHKCVLATGNMYFRNMLTSQWAETNSCKIEPPDGTTTIAFRNLLIYLYTGLIDEESLSQNVLELYELTTYFQVNGLHKAIIDHLANLISLDNAEDFLQYVDRHQDDEQFVNIVLNFIAKHSYSLAQRSFPFHLLKPYMLTQLFLRQVENNPFACPLQVGDKIEGNYMGRGTYYMGRISTVCSEEFFDIMYDDGSSELAVYRPLIKFISR